MKVLNFINENQDWEEKIVASPYFITVKRSDDYILLKYDQLKSDFNNEIVRECRGSIFRQENGVFKCVCAPFYKFGNYGESYVPAIDWNSALAMDKIDGSLIKLWYDCGTWHWSTNGTIRAEEANVLTNDNEFMTFYDLIEIALNKDFSFLDKLNKEFTYMFELVSPYNKVVISYDYTALFFLAARSNKTFKELPLKDLVEVYKTKLPACVKFPTYFKCTDATFLSAVAANLGKDKEGFVVVDKDFNRAKFKGQEYLAAARMRSNGVMKDSTLIALLLEGKEDDLTAYFPEFKERLNFLKAKLLTLAAQMEEVWAVASQMKSRKEVAAYVAGSPFAAYIFKRLDHKVESAKDFIFSLDSKKIVGLIK